MPPTGNSKSSFSDDEEKSEGSRPSQHQQETEQSDKEDEYDDAREDDDDDDDDEEETTSDPVVVSPGGSNAPESPESLVSFEAAADGITEEGEKQKSGEAVVKTVTKVSSSATKKDTTEFDKKLIATETLRTEKIPETPPNFVVAGFQKKATPLAIKSWSALAMTLDGRDKITKILQYSFRFLGWWFKAQNLELATRFNMLYKHFAKSRKAFRMGRSIIEFDKLRSMGLLGLIFWHIEQSLIEDDEKDDGENHGHHNSKPRPNVLIRKASSNIGWGPSTLPDDEAYYNESSRRSTSLSRSLSSLAYRRMYRPLLSRVSSTFSSKEEPQTELWKVLGSAGKILGLLGFWASDNMNFLLGTGAFDDMSISDPNQRAAKRTKLQSLVSTRGNQFYFGGSVAGFFTNFYAYLKFWKDTLPEAEAKFQEGEEGATSTEDRQRMHQQFKKIKEKQFSLFLALLKSCCDLMVFSNMPGIDLHKKYRGKKNHEGFHCLCGLISASTVIYNNFPDAK